MKHSILLITNQYPYGEGETFVRDELAALAKRFDKVVVAPRSNIGATRSLPEKAELERGCLMRDTYYNRIEYLVRALLNPEFWCEIIELLRTKRLNIAKFRRACYFAGYAAKLSKKVERVVAKHDFKHSILYSYWMDEASLAIARAKTRCANEVKICRVHGFDLYEEVNLPPYLPFRKEIESRLHRIFPISQAGMTILRHRFPTSPKLELARLGTSDVGLNPPRRCSEDRVVIVSCSSLVPVKRVHCIVNAIQLSSDLLPGLKIEWHHFGDGVLGSQLRQQAAAEITRAAWFFHGQRTNAELMEFYRSCTVDLFINVSESEGVPVSIMEALSVGIPVLATDVGGTGELVSERCGRLLPGKSDAKRIALEIAELLCNRPALEEKRKAAREVWLAYCQAESNYASFAASIAAVGP